MSRRPVGPLSRRRQARPSDPLDRSRRTGHAFFPAKATRVDALSPGLWQGIVRRLCLLALIAGTAGCGQDGPSAGARPASTEALPDKGLEAGFDRRFTAFYVDAAGGLANDLSPTRFARASGIVPADPPWSTPLPGHLRQGLAAPSREPALEAVHAQMRAAALDPEDLTDVATYHAALAWLIVQRRRLDPARLEALRAQVRPALLDRLDGEGELADATLQRMADALAVEAAQFGQAFSTLERRGDRAELEALGAALQQRYLVEAGIDLGR